MKTETRIILANPELRQSEPHTPPNQAGADTEAAESSRYAARRLRPDRQAPAAPNPFPAIEQMSQADLVSLALPASLWGAGWMAADRRRTWVGTSVSKATATRQHGAGEGGRAGGRAAR